MNIFERAARTKLRFNTAVGAITTEQVWDLPLDAANDRVSINQLGKAVKRALREADDVSFVENTTDAKATKLQLQLEILEHVRDAKIAQAEAALKRKENAARRAQIKTILAAKDIEKLAGKSEAALRKELAALED